MPSFKYLFSLHRKPRYSKKVRTACGSLKGVRNRQPHRNWRRCQSYVIFCKPTVLGIGKGENLSRGILTNS